MEELFETYKNLVYSLAFKLTGQRETTDNLFQDTWLQIVKSYDQIDSNKEVRNWIYTICLNCYRKNYNTTKRKKHFTQTYLSDEIKERTFNNLVDQSAVNAEIQVVKEERADFLKKVISDLHVLYKIPIILFYYENLSYEEISDVMEVPISTVKYRLYRGKRLIKKEMEEYENV